MNQRDESFNLIKRELVDDVKGWREEQKQTNEMLTGGNDPEKGVLYRLARLEEFRKEMVVQKEKRDKQIAGVITIALTAIATVIGDFVLGLWRHHK